MNWQALFVDISLATWLSVTGSEIWHVEQPLILKRSIPVLVAVTTRSQLSSGWNWHTGKISSFSFIVVYLF